MPLKARPAADKTADRASPRHRIFPRALVLQVAAGLGLVGFLLWRANLGDATDVARGAKYPYLLAGLPLYLATMYLGAQRWHMALRRPARPKVRELFGVFLTSAMVNNVMPFRLGDVLRVQVPARRYGLARPRLTALVFVTETLLDGFAFIVLVVATLAFLGLPSLPLAVVWTLTTLILVGVAVAAVAARLELREGWEHRGVVARLPAMVRRHASVLVPEFLDGLALLRDLPLATRALALTIGARLLQATLYYLFGLTFGLDLTPADAVLVMVTATLIVSVPLMPSSFGTYEVAVTGVLVLAGNSNAEALAYAFGTHLLNIAFSIAAGVVAMAFMRLSVRDLLFIRPE